MIDNKRFRSVVEFLKEKKYIRNQQDFSERVNSDKTTVSQIMNDRINIPNVMFGNIEKAFPIISTEWILTGEGEMLRPVSQSVGNIIESNVAGVNVHGNGITINPNAYEALLKIVEANQNSTKKFQEQIDRLINIIEAKYGTENR